MKTKMPDNLDTEAIVLDTLLRRRSTRAFDPSPVPAWKLRRVFEAARWAPSSFNEQPWRFIVTTDEQPAERQKLLESLYESNRVWAKDAPVLILAATHNSRRACLRRRGQESAWPAFFWASTLARAARKRC